MSRKQSLISVPTDLIELDERVALVGTLSRSIDSKKAALDAAIARLRDATNQELAPLSDRLERELRAIETFADANRSSILPEGVKSLSLASGKIGWRLTPPKVTFARNAAEKALEYLKRHRMKRFLRFSVEIDKEALLKHRPAIDGVRYKQVDEFFVEPSAGPTRTEAIGEIVVSSR